MTKKVIHKKDMASYLYINKWKTAQMEAFLKIQYIIITHNGAVMMDFYFMVVTQWRSYFTLCLFALYLLLKYIIIFLILFIQLYAIAILPFNFELSCFFFYLLNLNTLSLGLLPCMFSNYLQTQCL